MKSEPSSQVRASTLSMDPSFLSSSDQNGKDVTFGVQQTPDSQAILKEILPNKQGVSRFEDQGKKKVASKEQGWFDWPSFCCCASRKDESEVDEVASRTLEQETGMKTRMQARKDQLGNSLGLK